jgi:hypothetical protein
MKLSESKDSKNAFLIFPGTVSPEAKKAMTGFKISTSPQADGSTQVVMTSTNPEYKDQMYLVGAGNSLYFIERFAGEDNEQEDTDKGLKDDTAVIVDPSGYIVQ